MMKRLQTFLHERLLSVDTRTLALFRVFFGLLLLGNLYDRMSGGGFVAFYTNDGVFPNHYSLFAPVASRIWSPLFGFSTQSEVFWAMCVVAVVYVLYTVGYQTWLMKWLTLFCVLSVQNRALFMQNGGHVVTHIVAVWTAFLPLGDRWSVDALIRSLKARREKTAAELNERGWMGARRERAASIAYLFICLNFAVIYFFNTVHKNGTSWHGGTAVHWVLWQNRISTHLAEFLRLHEPGFLSPMLTWGTLFMEGSLPVLILTPWLRKYARALAILFVFSLHGGISLIATLGPFSYAMMSFSLLLVQKEHWDFLERLLRRPARARKVLYDESSPYQQQLMRLVSRFDGPGQLQFEAAGGEVRTDKERGKAAHRAIAAALPFGRLWAWPLVALMGADAKQQQRLTRAFGLDRRLEAEDLSPTEFGKAARMAGFIALQAAAVAIALPVASQILMENRAVPPAWRVATRPQWMTDTIDYLRIPQGWSMFAPEAPTTDVKLVIDAVLADGSHLDPLTHAPPDFEAPLKGPYYLDVQWCEYQVRIRGARYLWRGFRDYLNRIDELEGWPKEKQIVRFDVYEVLANSPPPGSTTVTGLQKNLLFRSEQPL